MAEMKTITISKRNKFRILHVEAPGCIVNIHIGLHTMDGQEATAVSIKCDQYAGEPKWTLPDYGDASCVNVRAVKQD